VLSTCPPPAPTGRGPAPTSATQARFVPRSSILAVVVPGGYIYPTNRHRPPALSLSHTAFIDVLTLRVPLLLLAETGPEAEQIAVARNGRYLSVPPPFSLSFSL
jgi:hypothetical protein